ncbi:MAG: hypothetical protein L3J30_00930 [Marinosulfonomonas sp.]|nr:hypothetical protein [Marinosulfonomonas sp.]
MATAKKPTGHKAAKAKEVVTDAVIIEEKAEAVDAPVNGKRKSAFVPLVLGGVLSGFVGFGAATYYFMNQPSDEAQALMQVQATLGEHGANLDEVRASVDDLSSAIEGVEADISGKVSGLAEATAQQDAELTDALNGMSGSIADFETRLTALEKRPIAEAGGMTGEAAAAYERELRTMRDLLETQRSDIEELAAEATARIEGVAQQAATAEQAAEKTAKATALTAAVSQLQSALDNGGTFEATLANLAATGVEIPPVLTEAAKGGVPTLAALQEAYPEAARAGLSASVKATTGDGAMDKLGSFFRSQVGARSLAPREGDDPDAVLSRAEAALVNGDIAAAITLIGALPEEGQTAMSAWVKDAGVRLQAVDAVRMLADGLNGN